MASLQYELATNANAQPAKKIKIEGTIVFEEAEQKAESPVDVYYNQVQDAANFVRARVLASDHYDDISQFNVATVLGSGLGAFADELSDQVAISYHDIPHFPTSSVKGHAGRMVIGKIGHQPIVVMQGRVHYYEGYTLNQVVFPIRVLAMLGIKLVIMTNAAGGVNFDFKVGDIMIITDHINFQFANALYGPNDSRFGVRFMDQSDAYSKGLRPYLRAAARNMGEKLQEGVYVAMSGPAYETPAEVRMVRGFGGDAVGMSTVPECTAANHSGMKVVGMSLITNAACGVGDAPLDHKEVQETGRRRAGVLKTLLGQWALSLGLMTSDIAVVDYKDIGADGVDPADLLVVSNVPGLEDAREKVLQAKGEGGDDISTVLKDVGNKVFPKHTADAQWSDNVWNAGATQHRNAREGGSFYRVFSAPGFVHQSKANHYVPEDPSCGFSLKMGDTMYPLSGLPANCALVIPQPANAAVSISSGEQKHFAWSVECFEGGA